MYSEEEKRLIALSMEWEGSIFIESHYDRRERKQRWQFHPRVTLVNTRIELMDYWMNLVKMGKITSFPRQNPNHKMLYEWNIYKYTDLIKLLLTIEKYLITKKEAAKLVIKFCQLRLKRCYKGNKERQYTTEEMEIAQKVSDLTRRTGKPRRIVMELASK